MSSEGHIHVNTIPLKTQDESLSKCDLGYLSSQHNVLIACQLRDANGCKMLDNAGYRVICFKAISTLYGSVLKEFYVDLPGRVDPAFAISVSSQSPTFYFYFPHPYPTMSTHSALSMVTKITIPLPHEQSHNVAKESFDLLTHGPELQDIDSFSVSPNKLVFLTCYSLWVVDLATKEVHCRDFAEPYLMSHLYHYPTILDDHLYFLDVPGFLFVGSIDINGDGEVVLQRKLLQNKPPFEDQMLLTKTDWKNFWPMTFLTDNCWHMLGMGNNRLIWYCIDLINGRGQLLSVRTFETLPFPKSFRPFVCDSTGDVCIVWMNEHNYAQLTTIKLKMGGPNAVLPLQMLAFNRLLSAYPAVSGMSSQQQADAGIPAKFRIRHY